ncbi:uncharacterized protein LAESUDRAFT_759365 [Laetiporus sulphureus 93-53]|uniref:Uncharacterized protein n=1 Tax=Laetiporus sulphureus 93-53 TaxID=1314785 RepID=A0A165E9Q3_9APHY|nr:uncharacterized protein LAESUDRAFT_759365 [Laetiporus sulphureus 93-53]KZT06544.1 hypothetical protein LAESUDRAFT_759365 [Laetiporus sulphureus 93-53]
MTSIPIILYDQLSNGHSTHLKEKPPMLWTIDLFINELISLLEHFTIQDAFDLLSHLQPKGLRHLILLDSLVALSLWSKANMQLLQEFPNEVQEGMGMEMKDPVKFYVALKQFHVKHACNIRPYLKEVQHSFNAIFGADVTTVQFNGLLHHVNNNIKSIEGTIQPLIQNVNLTTFIDDLVQVV